MSGPFTADLLAEKLLLVRGSLHIDTSFMIPVFLRLALQVRKLLRPYPYATTHMHQCPYISARLPDVMYSMRIVVIVCANGFLMNKLRGWVFRQINMLYWWSYNRLPLITNKFYANWCAQLLSCASCLS